MPRISGSELRKLIEVAAEQHGARRDEEPARARRRARLVSEATALFIRHGYRKTSVEEVARRAGVAKGTLYLYFPTKADLLLAALFEERRRTLDGFADILEADLSGRERLRLWLRDVVLSLRQSPLTVAFLGRHHDFLAVMDELDADYLEQALDTKVSFLSTLIADACPPEVTLTPETLRLRATTLIATFNSAGFFTDERLRMGLDLETLVDSLCAVLLDGLCAPPAAVGGARSSALALPGDP